MTETAEDREKSTEETLQKELMAAIAQDDPEALVAALERGASPHGSLRDFHTRRPLNTAVERGKLQLSRLLIAAGASTDLWSGPGMHGRPPLQMAAAQGNLAMVQLLIKSGASLNISFLDGSTPLIQAVKKGQRKVVQELLRAGANPLQSNNGGDTCLHVAAFYAHDDIAKDFINAGIDPNIMKTEKKNKWSAIESQAMRPLHMAAFGYAKHAAMARLLLEAGADVDASMSNGRTPLHIAAGRNNTEVAKVLLEYGCSLEVTSEENGEHKTPLHKAVDAGHVPFLQLLIDAGANLNPTDVYGRSPLITAIFNDKPNIAKILIKAGCDVDLRTKNGKYPLEIAMTKLSVVFTHMLLLAGCEVSVLDMHNLVAQWQSVNTNSGQYAWVLTPFSPRSLMQLCRSSIRTQLQSNFTKKLCMLPLPPRLQRFVGLDDIDEVYNAWFEMQRAPAFGLRLGGY